MNEILKMLNGLSADDLESVIVRANIILEKKRKEEDEQALLEQERLRQERLAQEKKRQEEIAELERKLNELKRQSMSQPEEPGVRGDSFVMYEQPKPAPKAAPAQPVTRAQPAPSPEKITCPYCHKLNVADSLFCSNCGKKMTGAPSATPSRAASVSRPAAQPQPSAAQVRYVDASVKAWEKLPDEFTLHASQEIFMHQPVRSGSYTYYMEVTNKRILISRRSAAAMGASMTLGLVGSLIAGGPKPWLEIPLIAVKRCWVDGKNFVIEADQNYVLKNKKFERFLPDLVNSAKR